MKMQDKEKESLSFRNSTLWEYIQVIIVAFVLVFGFMRPFVVEAFKIPSRSMEDTLLIGDRILVAKFMYGITIPFVKIPRSSIELDYRYDLNRADRRNKPISERLWKEFDKEKLPLSKEAFASMQKWDEERTVTEWFVTDGENSYTIIKKDGKLKVYSKIRILDFHKPAIGDVFVFTPPPESNRTQSFIKRIVGVSGDVIMVRNGDLYRNNEKITGENYVKRVYDPRAIRSYGPETVPPGHIFAMGDNRDLSSDSRKFGFVPIENIKGQAFLKYFSWDPDGDLLHKIRFSRLGRRIN